jgi:putative FmdB family regulatory protein
MPLHDFLCKKCNQSFELLVLSSTTSPSTVPRCPTCQGTDLQKLISAPQAPGKTAALMKEGRARAIKEGHATNYQRSSSGKIVD